MPAFWDSLPILFDDEFLSSSIYRSSGFAGDKGLNNPELNKSATKYLNDGLKNIISGYSTSRTCEIGMMTHSNIDYKSIAYLVRDYIYQTVK